MGLEDDAVEGRGKGDQSEHGAQRLAPSVVKALSQAARAQASFRRGTHLGALSRSCFRNKVPLAGLGFFHLAFRRLPSPKSSAVKTITSEQ